MKKSYLFIVAVLFSSMVMAQYHEVNWATIGANPREGMDEAEQPWGYLDQNYTGWSQILSAGATSWSSSQSMPFSFKFNGSTESSFVVHPSGLVTFSSSPSAPPSTPATLPNSSLPDKTIAVWGMNLGTASSNDGVVQKTFGQYPYRQHWIMWASASIPGVSGTNWAYWAVVFEESTNNIYIVDQRTYGGNVSLVAGVQVNSTTATSATGSPGLASQTTATAGNGSDASDNKVYAFVYGTQPTYDAAGQKLAMGPYAKVNTANDVPMEIVNYGTSAIFNVKVAISVNGGNPSTKLISGISLNTGARASVVATGALTPTVVGDANLKIWIQEVNGSSDANHLNDTIYGTVSVVSDIHQRVPLAEEFTSSTCGPCASFNPSYNQLLDANNVNTANGKVVAVKYQMNWPNPGTDPNYNPDGYTRRLYYGITGVPTPILDGVQGVASQAAIDDSYASGSPFEVEAVYNVSGTTMTVDVDVTPRLNKTNSDYVLYIAVLEKALYKSNYPGSQFPVTNGETDWFQVMRKMLPDGDGIALGTLSDGVTISKSESYTFTFGNVAQGNYNLWQDWSNIDVIAWVQDESNGMVVNSVLVEGQMIGIEEDSKQFGLEVYPNPASDYTNLHFDVEDNKTASIQVINAIGQTLISRTENLSVGASNIQISTADLIAGIYFVRVEIDGIPQTVKLTVK